MSNRSITPGKRLPSYNYKRNKVEKSDHEIYRDNMREAIREGDTESFKFWRELFDKTKNRNK